MYGTNTDFFENFYSEHIRAFNGFSEGNPTDGIPKNSREEFLRRFNENFEHIKNNGFDKEKSLLSLVEGGELCDGSHRLAICTLLGIDAYARRASEGGMYDYKWFNNQKIDRFYADYAALEYVKFNPNAYIVNLHSATHTNMDVEVESILSRYGFIYYKKEINLTYDGYVNVKKLSYGFDSNGNDSWVGNEANDFAGAKYHADHSKGKHPLRVFVFVCDNLEKVKTAKQKIREIYNIGNFSVHINDTHEEAIELAETYFNENSLFALNNRPYNLVTAEIDKYIKEVKKYAKEKNIPLETFCAGGSTPLGILGIRESRDFDLLHCSDDIDGIGDPNISSHDSELCYYPHNKIEIIMNPRYHFYYKGLKFITLDILSEMKKNRNEKPKDVRDIALIDDFMRGKKIKRKIALVKIKIKNTFKFIFRIAWRIARKIKKILIKNKIVEKLRSRFNTVFRKREIVTDDKLFLLERITKHAIPAFVNFSYDTIKTNTLSFVNSMKIETSPFEYKYSPSCKTPNIYSSAYACMIFSMFGELDKLTTKEKHMWAQYFNGFQNSKNGLFYDVTLQNEYYNDSDWWGGRHLALHLISVYGALGEKPQYPFYFLEKYYDITFLKNWLDEQDWHGKFTNENDIDNKIMNIAATLQYQRDFWQDKKAAQAIAFIQEYLLGKINSDTGLWGYFDIKNKDEISRAVQFAYHLFSMYFYDNIEIGNYEKIIDLVLKTQNEYGGFGVKLNSSACEDIDSLDILIRFSKLTTHKKKEINIALKKGFIWVLSNQNDDGGYVFRRNEPMRYGHEQMNSKKNESAMFPTWFRTLTVGYISNSLGDTHFKLIKMPGFLN